MAAKTQSATPLSRLSFFGFGSSPRSNPTSPLGGGTDDHDQEDWYIPYNGPYEKPKHVDSSQDRDSWGELLNGWLSEDSEGNGQSSGAKEGYVGEGGQRKSRSTRSRAASNASHITTSSGHVDPSRRSTTTRSPTMTRPNAQIRMPVLSFINLDQAGGVGDTPMPAERTTKHETSSSPHTHAPHSAPINNRASLASILSFGKKDLHHSSSMDHLSHERRGGIARSSSAVKRARANTSASVVPSASTSAVPMSVPTSGPSRQRANDASFSQRPEAVNEDSEYHYSALLVHQSTIGGNQQSHRIHTTDLSSRPHPYAVAFPSQSIAPEPPRSAPPPFRDKGKGRLFDRSKLTVTLLDPRGHGRVPAYLKPSPRNSLLKASYSTPNLRNIPKGKQRWLAAETWCDALILPRPRFAMRLMDGGPSGRIVSPPDSPVLASEAKLSSREDASRSSSQQANARKPPKKSSSMGNLISAAADRIPEQQTVATPNMDSTKLKPLRPKSFALDDMALPSPVPSLIQVLREGRQLEEERKAWQTAATKSFQNKRARSMSRARSKSLGGSHARPRVRVQDPDSSAFEFLAERTLLGNQIRPPTIHVHAPTTSKSSKDHSHTLSGTGLGTISSMFTQSNPHSQSHTQSHSYSQGHSRTVSRSRSHAHSNSLGTSVSHKSASNESSGVEHKRSQSLGRSALKLVKSTATNAAAFCGFNGAEKSNVTTPADGKADAIEGALKTTETRFISLQDQTRMEERRRNADGEVVVIIPTSPSMALAMLSRNPVGFGGFSGVSPTPSGLSTSAEGIGIAIGSPPHSDDHSNSHSHHQESREPILIPAHPYAQGSSYSYSQPIKLKILERPNVSTEVESPSPIGPSPISATDSVNRHRQPVLRPYAQPGHPYASASSRRDAQPPHHIDIPLNSTLYAELTPGHVRAFDAEEIRYSPYGMTLPQGVAASSSPEDIPSAVGHPYGPSANRYSELGFGDALARTLRDRPSLDSGLGTSETGGPNQSPDTELPRGGVLQSATRYTQSPVENPESSRQAAMRSNSETSYFDSNARPTLPPGETSFGVSSNALSSSPSENINPPAFRRATSVGTHLSTATRAGRSSGSSPGMVSHDSSPPLSPRPINASDDLERFRDLFFRPTDRISITSEEVRRPTMGSRSDSGSIPIDVSSQSSRSVSGLTNLARQLSEDLEELREEDQNVSGEFGDHGSPMWWGRRYGGLRGPRPDDMSDDPNAVLSQISSDSSSPPGTTLPLRLPNDGGFSNPTSNFPEDIDPEDMESSRASSILEGSQLHENPAQYLRVGEVEAVLTPPIMSAPHRFSTTLSINFGGQDAIRRSEDLPRLRTGSHHSASTTLVTPFTPDPTRSSYMTTNTDGSRMSGLSDFPVPPTQLVTLANMPSNPSYFERQSDNHLQPPSLVREPSHDTFGHRDNDYSPVGEAL